MPLGMEVGLGPGNIVLDGDSPPQEKVGQQPPIFAPCIVAKLDSVGQDATSPNFRPMYCGETAGWIKMPLGTEVGLGPGHIALGGDPAPSTKRGTAAPPTFQRMSKFVMQWSWLLRRS